MGKADKEENKDVNEGGEGSDDKAKHYTRTLQQQTQIHETWHNRTASGAYTKGAEESIRGGISAFLNEGIEYKYIFDKYTNLIYPPSPNWVTKKCEMASSFFC